MALATPSGTERTAFGPTPAGWPSWMPRSWWTTSAGSAPCVRAIVIIRPRASEKAAAVPPGLPRMTKHSLGPNSSSFIVTYIEPCPVRIFLVTPVRVRGLPLRASASEEKVCPLPSVAGGVTGGAVGASGEAGRLVRFSPPPFSGGRNGGIAGAVAVDRYPLAVQGVGLAVGVLDVLGRGVVGQIDGLGDSHRGVLLEG